MNSRSYRGNITQSDHSIVVTTINLSLFHQRVQLVQRQKPQKKIVNRSLLARNIEIQEAYKNSLQTFLTNSPINNNSSPNEQYN